MSGAPGQPYQVICQVYACPPDAESRVLAVLAGHELTLADGEDPGGLSLTGYYAAGQGRASEVGEALRAAAPDASWMIWQEPDEPGELGTVEAYAPSLGTYQGSCTADGEPVATRTDFEAFAVPVAGRTALSGLDGVLGGPWFRDREARSPGPAEENPEKPPGLRGETALSAWNRALSGRAAGRRRTRGKRRGQDPGPGMIRRRQ